MFEVLTKNMQLIGILIVAYLGSLGINTLLGLYYNIHSIKEEFSVSKLLEGLARGAIILISGLAITAVISLLPVILESFGISADNALFENVSVIAMAGIIVSTIIKYLSDALKKFYAILGANKEQQTEE